MSGLTPYAEKLAELLAEKNGTTPQQAVEQALKAQAARIGLSTTDDNRTTHHHNRSPGRLKGLMQTPKALFAPLSQDEIERWYQ